jgi:CHASE3 domain sensor protein
LLFWPQSSYQLFKNVPDARLAREDTKQTFLVVRSANAVAEAIQDAERGQRGYLITGRESYLEPYKLYVPRNASQQPRDVTALALTGTETVLLVDDDEIVRTTVASMLESLGYDVITAARGQRAYRSWKKARR